MTKDIWTKNILTALREGKDPPNKKTEMYIRNYSFHNGLLYWSARATSRRVVVRKDGNLRDAVTNEFHLPGHFG